MTNSITIGEIFAKTNQTFSTHFSYLATLAGLFVGLAFLTGMLGGTLALIFGPATFFLIMLLVLVIYAKMAIMVHRLVILEEKGLEHIMQWRLVEVKFIGWIVAVVLTVMALVFVLLKLTMPTVPTAAGLPGATVFFYLALLIGLGLLFSRLAMVFPATAAGHDLTLGESFQMTRNHKFFVFFLVVLVPYITNRILQKINPESWVLMLLVEVISVLVIIYEVGLLSHAYEALHDDPEDSDPDGEPTEWVG